MSGWLVWFWFSCLFSCLGSPILYRETQYTFWFAKLNFAEIMLWSVISAQHGGRQELVFVYYSWKKFTQQLHSTWRTVSQHTSILALWGLLFSLLHTRRHQEANPSPWHSASRMGKSGSQDESALFIWQVLNSCCCTLGADVL